MANQYKNKIIYNGTTLMDISDTTAIASDVGLGKDFYTASGAKAQGTAVTGNAISVVDTTDTNGGTIRTITAVDISDTTAVAADVASGKYFYTANGTKTTGTASGGGSSATLITKEITTNGTYTASSDSADGYSSVTVNVPTSGGGGSSGTQHTIRLVLDDDTVANLPIYYDGLYYDTLIRTSKPTMYNNKDVEKAFLDDTQWYSKWEFIVEGSFIPIKDSDTEIYFWLPDLKDLIPTVGSVWRITIDGTEYILTAKQFNSSFAVNRVGIGNPVRAGDEDDGSNVPFIFYNYNNTGFCGDTSLSVEAHSVKIERLINNSDVTPTAHFILFEFTDNTSTTLTYYTYINDFISNAITATVPTTYDSKTVTLAQLDGVTWYEVSGDIPLNTELVDYNAVRTGYIVGDSGAIEAGESWECVTDYLPIDSSMTFTFKMRDWYALGLYDANKNVVQVYASHDIADSTENDIVTGTLSSSRIPSTAKYVVLVGNPYNLSSNTLSLIRTV